ncbi:hypothetical protein BDZ89DRAFT_1046184 [Hymenopellis radicata]|nr:hypothetical protein BDZ89DRAFT_1046184 [Hymenopellis radicata]
MTVVAVMVVGDATVAGDATMAGASTGAVVINFISLADLRVATRSSLRLKWRIAAQAAFRSARYFPMPPDDAMLFTTSHQPRDNGEAGRRMLENVAVVLQKKHAPRRHRLPAGNAVSYRLLLYRRRRVGAVSRDVIAVVVAMDVVASSWSRHCREVDGRPERVPLLCEYRGSAVVAHQNRCVDPDLLHLKDVACSRQRGIGPQAVYPAEHRRHGDVVVAVVVVVVVEVAEVGLPQSWSSRDLDLRGDREKSVLSLSCRRSAGGWAADVADIVVPLLSRSWSWVWGYRENSCGLVEGAVVAALSSSSWRRGQGPRGGVVVVILEV